MDNPPLINNSRPRLLLLIVPALLLFVGLIFLSIHQVRLATLDLLYTPASATVTLDGTPVSPGKITLSPGTHTIKLEMYGFAPIEETLTLTPGSTTPAYYKLTPSEEFTKNWYSEHPSDATLAEGISSRIFDNSSATTKKLTASYPALKHLPIKQSSFSIYSSTCNESDPCILIISDSIHRDAALTFFRNNLDSDLGRYRFTFRDYVNPFKGEG